MTTLLWVLFAFLCGSLPLSLWLGKVALHADIRQYGDGNPGGANVWRAGGKWWGLLAIFLDALKGLVPVALANYGAGLNGWPLVGAALAPILGHAYSPFLGFRGGKTIATSFGVWTGLTLYVVPIVLGLSFAFWLLVLRSEAWAILLGMLCLLVFLLAAHAQPVLLGVWVGSLLILLWKHRAEFRRRPQLSKGILGRFFR